MCVCECSLDSYDPDDILKVKMPRGSVLLFTGGMIHGSGVNSTDVGRKSLLSSYQLGWLRPEQRFWHHRPLYDAIHGGGPPPFSSTVVELLGHPDPSFLASDAGVASASRQDYLEREIHYLGRRKEAVSRRVLGMRALRNRF